MSFNKRAIHVPMPAGAFYEKQRIKRDELVARYGESTVLRAELTACMNILIAVGMVRTSELVDIVVMQCEKVDQERRGAARLEADRG